MKILITLPENAKIGEKETFVFTALGRCFGETGSVSASLATELKVHITRNMSTKSAFIASLIYDLEQSYKDHSLTEKGQTDLNKTINELQILSIIYQECSQSNR
jgi:hypothetical protein